MQGKTPIRSLAVLLLALAGSLVHAEGIESPEFYVYLDHQARRMTLDGMEERLEALSAGRDPRELRRIDARTRNRIQEFFAAWEVSVSEHAAYGSRNADAIDAWLDANPGWAEDERTLQQEFEALSAKLSAASS